MLVGLKEAGVRGFVDTNQAAQQHNIEALLHTNGENVLSNGALYERVSNGKKMGECGFQENRALVDSKATAEWATRLQEI